MEKAIEVSQLPFPWQDHLNNEKNTRFIEFMIRILLLKQIQIRLNDVEGWKCPEKNVLIHFVFTKRT